VALARWAPAWLLPLLRELAQPGLAWQVRARASAGRVHLSIEAQTLHSGAAASRAALKALDARAWRERLQAVHGADAMLAVLADHESTESSAPALRVDLALQTEQEQAHAQL
jgi:hypothetical protein